MNKKVKFSGLWTAILSVVSVAYIFPILLVLINSFKKKAYISRYPFLQKPDFSRHLDGHYLSQYFLLR